MTKGWFEQLMATDATPALVAMLIFATILWVMLMVFGFLFVRALKNMNAERVGLYLDYTAELNTQAFAAVIGKQPDSKIAALDGQMQLFGSKKTLDASGQVYECMSKVLDARTDGSSREEVDRKIEKLSKAVSLVMSSMREDLMEKDDRAETRTDNFSRNRLLNFGKITK